MASGITSKEFGGKLDVFDTGKKLYIITETPWYFWLTTIFFVLALISIPYLLYLMYEFYEKIPEADKTHEDKKYFNGGIAMTVILSIAIIAVIAGFIATEARKGGGKLDREQLENYGKSLIVKGAAVRTADMIKEKGEKYLNQARDTIAAKVINGDNPTSVSNWIAKNDQEKQDAINEAIEKHKQEIGQQAQTTTNPSTQTTNPSTQTTNPSTEPVVTEPNNLVRKNVTGNLQESPVSLSRSYKRRKSPTKKKKASPKKKKSTSSRRK